MIEMAIFGCVEFNLAVVVDPASRAWKVRCRWRDDQADVEETVATLAKKRLLCDPFLLRRSYGGFSGC